MSIGNETIRRTYVDTAQSQTSSRVSLSTMPRYMQMLDGHDVRCYRLKSCGTSR